MKKRDEDDKFMGQPMFPRLHINDTEKGGPRAPPRNKMALYEQLTIPSQSYNSGGAVSPTLNLNNNIGLASFTSKNKGINHERRIHLPPSQPPLQPSYSHNELQGIEVVNLSNQPSQPKQRMVKEDDPVISNFSYQGVGQCTGATQKSGHEERLLPNGGKKANHNSEDLLSRQKVNQERRNLKESDASDRYLDTSYQKHREKGGVQQQQQDKRILRSPEETEVCPLQDLGNDLPAADAGFGEDDSDMPMASTQKDMSLQLKHNPCVGYGCGDANGMDRGMLRLDDSSVERENADRGDDMSETSILDSASALGISVEDVVGMMGTQNYCRARTAIANQQRMLSAQVFELHRLMKVQGLIAGSPHLLLKDSAFMNETSLKDFNVQKYSSEFAVKALADSVKKKDDSKDPNDKAECAPDNAFSKIPPVLAPKSSPHLNTDPGMSSLSFHQPGSHQWLVPVMCPSQGLVYKPCPAPGFMGTVYGGYGPSGSVPAVGNLMLPAYGMAQGFHHGGQGYVHPYGLPIMSPNVPGLVADQMSKFAQANPRGQIGCVSTTNSSNGPIEKNRPSLPGAKVGDLQRTAAISPSPESQGPGTAHPTKGGDSRPHFPVSAFAGFSPGAPTAEKSSRLVRVVPRDRGSTRESAARIFQSIQEERQQGSN